MWGGRTGGMSLNGEGEKEEDTESGQWKPEARPCICPLSAGVPLPPRKQQTEAWGAWW